MGFCEVALRVDLKRETLVGPLVFDVVYFCIRPFSQSLNFFES